MKKFILMVVLTLISVSLISYIPLNNSLAVRDETTTEEVVQKLADLQKPVYDIVIVEDEVIALAQMAWGEARGCSDVEIAATMWVVLNRADNWNKSVLEVVTAPMQFHGYSPYHPVEDRLYDLAVDVLTRWQMEKQGASAEEVGRVLPQEYMWFHGDGVANHFRTSWQGGITWDWSLPNPYETEDN